MTRIRVRFPHDREAELLMRRQDLFWRRMRQIHLQSQSDRKPLRRELCIGVDLDGTLADHVAAVVPRANTLLGASVTLEAARAARDLGRLYGVSTGEWRRLMERLAPDIYRTMDLMPGATAARALSFRHRLVVVSERPEAHRSATEEWLERAGIHAAALVLDTPARQRAKLAADLRLDLHVDDDPAVAAAWSGRARLYLFDTPANAAARWPYRLSWLDREVYADLLAAGRLPVPRPARSVSSR